MSFAEGYYSPACIGMVNFRALAVPREVPHSCYQ